MISTRKEYMEELRAALSDFDPEFSSELLDDIERHFAGSLEEGKSEADICQELGSVENMIRELEETFPSSTPDVPKMAAPRQEETQEQTPPVLKRLCIQLQNASVQIVSGAVSDVVCHYDRSDFDERFVMYTEGDGFYLKEKPLSFLRLIGIGRGTGGSFSLTLPPSVQEIQVSTSNGQILLESLKTRSLSLGAPNGSLRLSDVSGVSAQLRCVNGRTTLHSCRFGSLDASSVNGSLEIDGEYGSCSVSSTNGSLNFHGMAGKTLELHTVNGKIHAVYQKSSDGARLSLSSTSGSITADCNGSLVKCRRRFETSYGGGSLNIQAKTVNGSIRIEEEA